MRRTTLVVFLPLLLCSCTTIHLGRDFDVSAFDTKVQRGVTTQAEVRSWVGTPAGVGVSVDKGGERLQEWTYYYGQGHLTSAAAAQFKILQVKFDQRGVVQAYSWSGEEK